MRSKQKILDATLGLIAEGGFEDVTIAAAARAAGVTRQTIIAIEQGKYSPSLEVAFRIAVVFGKPLDEVSVLFSGSKEVVSDIKLLS